MKSTGSFSVKSHDFSERLGNDHFETLSNEISKSLSVFIEVSRNEALISGIEEWVKSSLLDDGSNLFPLVKSWINTGWVVSTGVKHHGGTWSSSSKIGNHTFEIKTFGLFVEISILSNVKTTFGKDGVVISPCWITNVNWGRFVFLKEFSDHSKGTCS